MTRIKGSRGVVGPHLLNACTSATGTAFMLRRWPTGAHQEGESDKTKVGHNGPRRAMIVGDAEGIDVDAGFAN